MKKLLSYLSLSLLLCLSVPMAAADEFVTLPLETPGNQYGYSEQLTLAQGDSAELIYYTGYLLKVLVTIGGKEHELSPSNGVTGLRLVVAGPAAMKLRISSPTSEGSFIGFATFSVHRAGSASAPVPIPQEAGTTWQVILESSSDLVNWTAVSPGDYPASTPQRYFRTRLVKR